MSKLRNRFREHARHAPTIREERGAALMIVLIALVGLTAMAAAGVVVSGTELRSSGHADAAAQAFYAADAGLREYLGTVKDPTVTGTYTYGDATATVTATAMLDMPDGGGVYEIVSQGAFPVADGGAATRTARTLALYDTGLITAQASFASGSGLIKNGSSGTLSGADYSTGGDPDCPNSPGSAVAGVSVPPGGYTQNGGGSSVPDGDPDIDDSQSALELLEATGIDWDGIVNGGLIDPDYSVPPDSWPNFASLPADEYPVIYVTDPNIELSPSESGRGTIIVRDNLALNGSFQWDGMLLVGGYITSNGYQTIEGATIAGLNLLLGETVATSDIGNGNKKFLYHSCHLLKASKGAFAGLIEIPGSWRERM